jgi:putative MATE family efflux protein
MTEAPASPSTSSQARFTTGSTMRHVVVMTATGSVGLMALFVVDFADMYFLSLLGEREVAGAIGFAGAILMLNISVCIGLSIAISALVSRAVGAGRREDARQYAASTVLFAVLVTLGLAVILWLGAGRLLSLLGATGETHDIGLSYARIIVPSLPILGLGMCFSGILRALGDPKRAMYTTLTGSIVNVVLDPILIFGMALGVDGAAIASVAAHVAIAGVGFYGVVSVHRFLPWPRWSWFVRDLRAVSGIAVPAIATNIATPFSMAYTTAVMAGFGDSAVAAWAIIGRIVPLCFGVIFSLSGAIGPIIGQNHGAMLIERVRRSYLDALKFAGIYVIAVCIALFALQDAIIALFNTSAEAAVLVALFCTWIAVSWAFAGAQYVAIAAFNNLGKAHWSTIANWGKATLGTVPFIHYGAQWGGAAGALWGMALGSVVFGIAAAAVGYLLVRRLAPAGT